MPKRSCRLIASSHDIRNTNAANSAKDRCRPPSRRRDDHHSSDIAKASMNSCTVEYHEARLISHCSENRRLMKKNGMPAHQSATENKPSKISTANNQPMTRLKSRISITSPLPAHNLYSSSGFQQRV